MQTAHAVAQRSRRLPLFGLIGIGTILCLPALAQRAAQPLQSAHIAGSIHWVSGGTGANVSFSAGPDGIFIVDSKSQRDARGILEFAEGATDAPLRYLVNTHEHPDHTDGNERIAAAGAIIVAHEAVREILAAGQRGGPAAPDTALPVITFGDLGSINFAMNGETIEVFHVAPAHAPGNSIVHYTGSNVIHMGDLFNPARYPVLAGGTLEGFITALNIAVRRADVETVVIPGTGPLSDREGLINFREMLIAVRERLIDALDQGQSLEQFIATRPTREFDAVYGDPSHALFLPVLYAEMSARRQ